MINKSLAWIWCIMIGTCMSSVIFWAFASSFPKSSGWSPMMPRFSIIRSLFPVSAHSALYALYSMHEGSRCSNAKCEARWDQSQKLMIFHFLPPKIQYKQTFQFQIRFENSKVLLKVQCFNIRRFCWLFDQNFSLNF